MSYRKNSVTGQIYHRTIDGKEHRLGWVAFGKLSKQWLFIPKFQVPAGYKYKYPTEDAAVQACIRFYELLLRGRKYV